MWIKRTMALFTMVTCTLVTSAVFAVTESQYKVSVTGIAVVNDNNNFFDDEVVTNEVVTIEQLNVSVTGIAVVDDFTMWNTDVADDVAANVAFSSPQTHLEVPYGKCLFIRMSCDFPKECDVCLWVSADRWVAGADGWAVTSSAYNCHEKDTAHGFISLERNRKDCTLESVEVFAVMYRPFYTQWTICTAPINVLFIKDADYFVDFFDDLDLGGEIPTQRFNIGEPQKLPKNTHTREGYEFQGWTESWEDAANGIWTYRDEEEITVDHDMCLYAVWTSPPLTLTAESADWTEGSITLRCEDGDTSGKEHTYTLSYYDESRNDWEVVNNAVITPDADGITHLKDPAFSSRLGGIPPVQYRVSDENGRKMECVTRTRYGMFVGINRYPSMPKEKQLEACVTDAEGWKNILSTSDDSPLITDDLGTKNYILNTLTHWPRPIKPGDTFFYTHSGHGDVNVLRSYHSRTNSTLEDITAREFAEALMEFPKGVGVIVILDTCSSGSIPPVSGAKNGTWLATSFPVNHSFAESVMAEINATSKRKLLAIKSSGETETSYPKISSGNEIGWLTATDSLQDSWDGAFSRACLQIAGWRYGGADYNNDGIVNFHELGQFATYWFGRIYDECGMTPQMFSRSILSAICAGRVPLPNVYNKLAAPDIKTVSSDKAYRVTINWDAVPGAESYRIAWITNSVTNFCYETTTRATSQYLKPGTVVSAYVKAENKMDISPRSETVVGVAAIDTDFEDRVFKCDWNAICTTSVNPIHNDGTIDYDKLNIDHDGDGLTSFEECIAGSDPLDAQSVFRTIISTGSQLVPKIGWEPDTPELRATRVYRTFGKKTLLDADWVDITGKDQSEYHFFRVTVDLP